MCTWQVRGAVPSRAPACDLLRTRRTPTCPPVRAPYRRYNPATPPPPPCADFYVDMRKHSFAMQVGRGCAGVRYVSVPAPSPPAS
jgi:hypothetical protein